MNVKIKYVIFSQKLNFSQKTCKIIYRLNILGLGESEFKPVESKTSVSTSVELSLDVEAGKSGSDARRLMVFSH
jgi:hypothetical protein